MNLGNIGFMEILVILLLVLLLFGAKRLPEIGQSMGKGIREFKRSISDMDRPAVEPSRDERLRPAERDTVVPRDEASRRDPKRLLG